VNYVGAANINKSVRGAALFANINGEQNEKFGVVVLVTPNFPLRLELLLQDIE
jgi:hypothetical protein